LLPHDTDVILAGTINDIKISQTKNPKPGRPNQFAMFTLEDIQGSIRSILWAESYVKYTQLVKSETIVFAVGRIDRSRSVNVNDGNMIIDDLFAVDQDGIDKIMEQLTRGFKITFDEQRHPLEKVNKLYEILRGSPGQGIVELAVQLRSGDIAKFQMSKVKIAIKSELRQRVVDLLGAESISMLKSPSKKRENKNSYPKRSWQR
jgi:DNA polymerase-3 subunit alpha